MTRKRYDDNDNGDNVDHKHDSDYNYDSEDEYEEYQQYEYEEFQHEISEERRCLKWWDEITTCPHLYHLKNTSYSWFEELLETGVRPEQFQTVFKDEIYDFPIFEPVPQELRDQGITQEIWELIC